MGNHAALWPVGSTSPIDLGTLGGPTSGAYAISDAGVVVGFSETGIGGVDCVWLCPSHAMSWDPATAIMKDLGARGGSSIAMGINIAGSIVGGASTSDGWRAVRFLPNS